MRIWSNSCVKVVLAATATAAAVCDTKNGEENNGGVAVFRPDPDKYYWIEHVESGLVLEKAVDRGEAFVDVDPEEYGWSWLSFDAPLKLASSENEKNSSFAHWRFVPLDDDNSNAYYALVNRGCGQYVTRNSTTTVVVTNGDDEEEDEDGGVTYATLISAESIADLDARLDLPHFQCVDGGTTTSGSGTTNNQSNDDHVLIYMNNYNRKDGDGDARTTTYATCFSSQARQVEDDEDGETSPPCYKEGEKVGFLLPVVNNNATKNSTLANGMTTNSSSAPAAVWRIRVVTNYTKADYYQGEDVQGGMTNIFAPDDDDDGNIVGTAEAASASIALTGTALEEAEERRRKNNAAKKCTTVRSAKGRAMCGVGFAMVGTGLQLADVVVPNAIENNQENQEQQESSGGKMEQLRADVERIANQMSATGRVTNEVEELQDALDAALRYMFRGYAREKARLIEERDLGELDDLADTLLQDRAEGLKSKIRDTFRRTYVGPPDVAAADAWQDPSMILFGYAGFDLLKVSIVQTMAMFQEAILLDVYSKPDKSCEVAVDEADLAALAEEYKNLLQDAQQGFIDVRLANIEIAEGTVDSCGPVAGLICTLDYSYREVRDPYLPTENFLGQLRDDDNDDDLYERTVEFFQDTFNRSVPLYRAELEHDIRTWSYPIQNEVVFLENYINRTLQACRDLQTDSEARAAYETSLQVFADSSTSAGGDEDDQNVGVEDDENSNASSNNGNGESGNNTTEAAGTSNNGSNSFDNIAETSGAHCATSSVSTAISTAAGLLVLAAASVASSLGGGGCFCLWFGW